MFGKALRKLVLVNATGAFAVVVLLLGAAFFLIRANLENNANQNLEGVAQTIAASDLNELFEDHDDVEEKYGDLLSINNPTFWVIDSSGEVVLTNGRRGEDVMSAEGVVDASDGTSQSSMVERSDGVHRVVTVRSNSSSPRYFVQVSELDTVGPELSPIINSLVVAGAVGLALAIVIGYFVARNTMRPIERAFELQREFISGASHELRTPITVVQANADAVQRLVSGLRPEDARLLEDIQVESEFLGELVARLAELARLQDDFDTPLEVVDLDQLIHETVRSMTLLAGRAGMSVIAVEARGQVDGLADRIMLRQVVQSLVENAFKYAGKEATVELSVKSVGAACELAVRDDGAGIPAEQVAHVTERFYRVDKARSRSAGSSGLGLAMASEAITAMGGTLAVESTEGQGTSVVIRLPAASS